MPTLVACYINRNHFLTSVFIGREIKVILLNYVAKRMTEKHDACHEKKDLKVFVVVMPREGWARVAAPILLLA